MWIKTTTTDIKLRCKQIKDDGWRWIKSTLLIKQTYVRCKRKAQNILPKTLYWTIKRKIRYTYFKYLLKSLFPGAKILFVVLLFFWRNVIFCAITELIQSAIIRHAVQYAVQITIWTLCKQYKALYFYLILMDAHSCLKNKFYAIRFFINFEVKQMHLYI